MTETERLIAIAGHASHVTSQASALHERLLTGQASAYAAALTASEHLRADRVRDARRDLERAERLAGDVLRALGEIRGLLSGVP